MDDQTASDQAGQPFKDAAEENRQRRRWNAFLASLFTVLQLAGFILVAIWWSELRLPPPGYAVAFLAVATALMSIQPEMRGWQKAVWMLLIGALLVVELRAITLERSAAAKQAKVDREQQNESFASVLRKQDSEMAQTIVGLQQGTDNAKRLLAEAQQISESTRKNLSALMGDGSYPCIVPQPQVYADRGIPLVLWTRGRNDLTGVEVRVLSQEEFLDGRSLFYKPSAVLGTVHPRWPKPLPEGLLPRTGEDGIAHYTAEIWTQNGFYTEMLNFKRSSQPNQTWAYQYWLHKQVHLDHRVGKIPPGADAGILMRDCYRGPWSDE